MWSPAQNRPTLGIRPSVAGGRRLRRGRENIVAHRAVQSIFMQSFLNVPGGSQPAFSRIRISSGGEEE